MVGVVKRVGLFCLLGYAPDPKFERVESYHDRHKDYLRARYLATGSRHRAGSKSRGVSSPLLAIGYPMQSGLARARKFFSFSFFLQVLPVFLRFVSVLVVYDFLIFFAYLLLFFIAFSLFDVFLWVIFLVLFRALVRSGWYFCRWSLFIIASATCISSLFHFSSYYFFSPSSLLERENASFQI